jgi:hypothetical protein
MTGNNGSRVSFEASLFADINNSIIDTFYSQGTTREKVSLSFFHPFFLSFLA